jgi:hypothetical protein
VWNSSEIASQAAWRDEAAGLLNRLGALRFVTSTEARNGTEE